MQSESKNHHAQVYAAINHLQQQVGYQLICVCYSVTIHMSVSHLSHLNINHIKGIRKTGNMKNFQILHSTIHKNVLVCVCDIILFFYYCYSQVQPHFTTVLGPACSENYSYSVTYVHCIKKLQHGIKNNFLVTGC